MTEIAGVHGPEYGDIGINGDGDHVVYARADGAGGIVAYGPIPNTYPAGLTGDKTITARVMVPEAGYVKFFEVAYLRLSMIPFGSGWKPTAYVVTPTGDATVTGDEIALSSSTAVDLAATYDAATGTLELLVDGLAVNDTTFGEARDTQIGLPIWQAGAAPGGWVGFGGLFDSVITFATPPTVTIDKASGQADPTASGAASVFFDVVFSEAVTGFTGADVTISGTAFTGSGTASVSGSGTTYTVEVTGMDNTAGGTVIADIGAGVATGSVSGLTNAASTSTDNSIAWTMPGFDDFNRATTGTSTATNRFGADWYVQGSTGIQINAGGNAVESTANAKRSATWNHDLGTVDMWAEMDVFPGAAAAGVAGLTVRSNYPTADTNYIGRYNQNLSQWEIVRCVAGTETLLASAASPDPGGSYRIRFESETVSGNVDLRLYELTVGDVLGAKTSRLTYTDSSGSKLTSPNFAGLMTQFANTTSPRWTIDNYAVGVL